MKKKRNIVAVLTKKHLRTNWGFIFNTAIQAHVENFMLSIHVNSSKGYWLCYEDEAPKGVYTNVFVKTIYNKDRTIQKITYHIK